MSRDEITRMAREASEETNWKPALGNEHVVDFLERFFHAAYAAGAAADREAILQMSREQWFKTQADFEEAIRARSQQ